MPHDKNASLRLIPSECRSTFEQVDWNNSVLGPPDRWSNALRNAVQVCLNSQFPMTLGWGDDNVIIYNDGYLPIVGPKHPSVFGIPAREGYPEIWESYLKSRLERAKSGEPVWEENFLLPLLRDGVARESYFTFCYSPIPDDDGELRGVLSTAVETTHDVLSRRRGAQQLALSHALSNLTNRREILERFAEVIGSQNPDCIAWALLGVIETASVTGVECASTSTLHNALASTLPSDLQEILSTHGLTAGVPVTTASNHHHVLAVRPQSLTQVDDDYRAHLASLQNIIDASLTHLARAEQHTAERESLYQLLFQHSADATILSAPDGRVFAVNPAVQKLTGWSEQELGQLGRVGLVDATNPVVEAALRQRQETGYFSGDLPVKTKDGKGMICELTSILFKNEQGEERSMILLKDAEARDAKLRKEHDVTRMEAIGQLTGGVAHDFNNLLQVIISGTDEILNVSTEDSTISKYGSMVFSAALKASDLTSQLLSFSSKQSLIPKPASMVDVVREMDQILVRALGKRIKVDLNLKSDGNALLDVSLAQNAILNLALNSKDAMGGEGTLVIASGRETISFDRARELGCEPGDYVAVSVSDSGEGIPSENLTRVIEPFFTTKTGDKGHGLGLSSVFGFVKQSKGAMSIESKEGEGTKVTLYFPETSETARHQDSFTPMNIRGDGEHVFVVEDNLLLANLLIEILERNGYRVSHFVDGDSALTHIKGGHHAAAMMSDVMLGSGIDGWELSKKARILCPDMKLILMSGYTGEVLKEHHHHHNIPVLAKPFRSDDVLSLLNQQLASNT